MNNTVDGMNIFKCGFEFQSIPHVDTCQAIRGMARRSSSAVDKHS